MQGKAFPFGRFPAAFSNYGQYFYQLKFDPQPLLFNAYRRLVVALLTELNARV
jgi:hypothetical protein